MLAALALVGCEPGQGPSPSRFADPAPSATPEPVSRAQALADELTATARERRDGDPSTGDAPEDVAAGAARIEQIQRTLAKRPRLARRTLARLSGRVLAEARDVIAARRALDVLNAPRPGVEPPKVRRGPPEPADVLRGYYREAHRRSGVSAKLLAAVNLIESDFGRVRNNSVAGAQGPMQFMPATWDSYGHGGDVHDPHDAILGAARFLAAAGARHDEAAALYRYNPSQLYVTAVSRYARRMRSDPLAFYALYASGAAD